MPPNCSETLLPEARHQNLEKALSKESIQDDDGDTECRCDQVSYGTGDAVFTSMVVAPMVVSTWRGTWGVMDLHPDLFPYAQIFLLGLILHVCFAVVRTQLLARAASPPGRQAPPTTWLRERVLSRVYTYVFILANIMHWRGGWGLFDGVVATLLPDPLDPHRAVLIAAFVLLFYIMIVTLRASRNLLASPYFLVTDGKEPTYIFSTRFNTSVLINFSRMPSSDPGFLIMVPPMDYLISNKNNNHQNWFRNDEVIHKHT